MAYWELTATCWSNTKSVFFQEKILNYLISSILFDVDSLWVNWISLLNILIKGKIKSILLNEYEHLNSNRNESLRNISHELAELDHNTYHTQFSEAFARTQTIQKLSINIQQKFK